MFFHEVAPFWLNALMSNNCIVVVVISLALLKDFCVLEIKSCCLVVLM